MDRRHGSGAAGRIGALVICGALLAAACGNGDGPGGSGVDGEPDARGFTTLGEGGLEERYRVVLLMETPTAADAGEVVLAQDPPQRSIRYERDGERAFIILTGDGSSVVCATPDDPCIRVPAERGFDAEGVLSPFLGGLTAFREVEEVPGYEFRGRTQLAGRSAVCASWRPPFAGEGIFEQCLDETTGVILAWTFEVPEEGRVSFEAVELGDPAGPDFEPTGPIQELS